MTVSRETLMAFIDGALPPEEMTRVTREVAADAALRAEVERQQAMIRTLQSAFAPVLNAPVPERLIRAATRRHASWPERFAARLRHMLTQHPFAAGSSLAGAALASGLAIGLMLQPGATGNFAPSPQGLVARADLAEALQTRLAATQDPHATAQIGVSFRRGDGTLCRTFVASGNAGIACRDSSAWRVIALAPATGAEARGDYHMASATIPDAIRDTAAAMIAGAPLTRRQESDAVKSGWR